MTSLVFFLLLLVYLIMLVTFSEIVVASIQPPVVVYFVPRICISHLFSVLSRFCYVYKVRADAYVSYTFLRLHVIIRSKKLCNQKLVSQCVDWNINVPRVTAM